MRRRRGISFYVGRADGDRFRSLLAAIGCLDGWHEPDPRFPRANPGFDFWFDEGDARAEKLLVLLRAQQITWLEQGEIIYTEAELRAAPLLVFSLRTAERDVSRHEPSVFDFSRGCPHCHAGAPQVALLRLRRPSRLSARAMICQTMDSEYLVTEPLYQALAKADLRGLELMQALDGAGNRLPWWQMVPRYQMPPMSPATRGIVRGTNKDGQPMGGCHQCWRDNHFHTMKEPPQIVYRRSDLGSGPLPDVAETYECFGISGDNPLRVARGLMLVSPRVLEIFRALKVRRVVFEPVQIVDE